MNDEQKAQQYSNLTYGFDRIANEIASIKGESIDLNQEQQVRINKLQEHNNFFLNEPTRTIGYTNRHGWNCNFYAHNYSHGSNRGGKADNVFFTLPLR